MEDSPLAEASHAPSNNIWHVDYNATVAKDAAMGWQGMGFVLGFNGVMFLVALAIFQRGARSTRFSLFRFGSSSILSARAQEAAQFTLKKWGDLLWRTPIRDTDVEMRLGPEGTFYLLYQQYTARFLGVLSVFAMVVLLPLYLTIGANAMQQVEAAAEAAVKGIEAIAQGSTDGATDLYAVDDAASEMTSGSAAQEDDTKWWSFAHATIRVMPHESPYLWVPVVMCYLTTIAFLLYYRQLSALATIPTHNPRRDHKLAGLTQRSSSIMSNGTSVATAGQTAGEEKSVNAAEDTVTPEVIVSPGKAKTEAEDPEKQPLLGKDKEMATLDKTPERTHLIGMQPSSLSNRSLFVDRGVPKNLREQRMLRLLDEVFPGYVEDVSVVFNLAEFHSLQARRRQEETDLARMKILHQRELNGEKPSWSLRLLPGGVMIPSLRLVFTNLFCCFRWCAKPVPMEEQEEQLANHIKKLREKEMTCLSRILHENKGAGRAFVIFKSARLRARFVRRVRNQSITSILARFPEHSQPRLVRYVRELGLTRWHLEAAPEPDDIDWQSVSFPFAKRTVVVLLVNVCILVVLLLFTSPIAVTSAISSSSSYSTGAAQSLSDLVAQLGDLLRKVSPRMAKLLANYIPTLILVMINAVLLNVLQIAGRIQPISTDSAKERLILRTASVYLIFNTIFVPSLAFMSIDAVLLYLEDDGEVLGMLGTLFLHNSGIFYVDYILQRCFLGTALVLLRATEYVKFAWAKPRALTPREQVQAVEADLFYTGTQSAMQISTLTVVLMFSTVVPLILPLGTLYFVMQHGVDKYSLLNVRRRIKGRGSIARTATHATCVSLLLYQGAMSGFILERGTTTQSAAVLVLLMGTYIVVLWGYVRDKEQQHHMIARSGHNSLEHSNSLQSSGVPMKTEFPLSMLNSSLQPLEENDSKDQEQGKEQGEPEEPPAGDEEASTAESASTRRPLETLSESSALLMLPTSSDPDLLTDHLLLVVVEASIYPEVLLGTSNKSLVIVSKDGGAQDMKLQESIAAPISAVAIAPNGLFMALFTQDGILTVLNTMMDKKILSFDTQSKASPLSMCWCGEDSVLMYWPSAGLVMVGPYGSWLRFPYSESIILAQEVDCCRVYSASSHDIVLRVPTCVENIKGVGSTAPAAMLYQALDAFDSGDAKADEHIRFILSQNALEDAIKDCVDAAGSEFDYASQTTLMRAASYGKCFVDSAMDASSALPGGAGSGGNAMMDAELFVDMCRKIRVLNALRQQEIGFPLTVTQFDRLTAEVVVSRLVAMRHHFLALKICEYLKIPTDRVLVHWACEKVKAATSSNVSDEELVALVRKKLKNATLVSYADIANCAERVNRRRLATMFLDLEENASDQVPLLLSMGEERVNRRRLATMFLDLEENASDQVPLLLSMGEFELALRKSLESNNTDLIYMTLFHLERTLPSMDEFRYVLNREPMYAEAVNLMLLYYRATKSSGSPALWTDVASAENDLLLSFKSTDVEEKLTALKDATTKYTNAKLPSHAKLTEEQMELLQEQGKLEEKPENVKRRKLVGLSISNTMKLLLRDSKYEPKLLPLVAAFAKKFKVPDKRFYRVKIKALAETRQWDALHKFSMEKKTPPCGFKAFAIACLEEGEKQQAENYTARITSVDEKFETLIHLDMYSDALQLAIKLKDPEKLTNVRNLCNDDNICNQADKAAMELGFVS
ncbi:hypothetical protein PPTG_22686 [Phytophthora nicotianae INRA-310]|uniref:Uncharacterized protein n=1 Tax=Phytophthora nicotianae (strain INRA-310) TaxID=761204 RepID=W2QDW9_PHYN3|nr:hypothetical protein PPTG_22686 [Phytophthora nicotianae INRA-310]ETN10724.1 hypothetical protein PPTG_22686 [Phytophthora nicotianae INRA-310]